VYASGATTASLIWFFGLALGARYLSPWLSTPRAWRILDAEGLTVVTPTGSRGHPLTTHARQLGQRLESLMAKFAIVAPGRAVERPRQDEEDEVSTWAGVLPKVHDFYGGPRRAG